LTISIVLRPNQRADSLKQCGAGRRQLRIVFSDLTQEAKREWISIQVLKAMCIEMIDYMVGISLWVTFDKKVRSLSTLQGIKRKDCRVGAVKLAQVGDTTCLPLAGAA
jgi:hypothetical protein